MSHPREFDPDELLGQLRCMDMGRARRPRWEYLTFDFEWWKDNGHDEVDLHTLGAEGWELVSMSAVFEVECCDHDSWTRGYFKRQVVD